MKVKTVFTMIKKGFGDVDGLDYIEEILTDYEQNEDPQEVQDLMNILMDDLIALEGDVERAVALFVSKFPEFKKGENE